MFAYVSGDAQPTLRSTVPSWLERPLAWLPVQVPALFVSVNAPPPTF